MGDAPSTFAHATKFAKDLLSPDVKLPSPNQVTPKQPNPLADLSGVNMRRQQFRAMTAGGSIFGGSGAQIGNNPNQPRKSLIGS